MKILLLGATDLTRSIGETLIDMSSEFDIDLIGVVTVPKTFAISYAPNGVTNSREVDLATWCMERDMPCVIYNSPDDILSICDDSGADIALLAGWYHKVPARIRSGFPLGCIGLHASLLPKYRGGAPLNWAILNEDKEAGISLLELDDGMDTGKLYGQRAFPISDDCYIQHVIALAESAAIDLVKECLPKIASSSLLPYKQVGKATYGLQRKPDDGYIVWSNDAAKISVLIRAVSRPYSGAYTYLDGKKIIIWRASVPVDHPVIHGAIGQFVRLDGMDSIVVVTGDGLLRIEEASFSDDSDAIATLKRSSQRHFDTR